MLTFLTINFAPKISGLTFLIELFAVFAFLKGWFQPSVYKFLLEGIRQARSSVSQMVEAKKRCKYWLKVVNEKLDKIKVEDRDSFQAGMESQLIAEQTALEHILEGFDD